MGLFIVTEKFLALSHEQMEYSRTGDPARRATGPSVAFGPVSPGPPRGFGGFRSRSGRPTLDKTGRSGGRGAFFPSRAAWALLDWTALDYTTAALMCCRQGTHLRFGVGFLLSAARTA